MALVQPTISDRRSRLLLRWSSRAQSLNPLAGQTATLVRATAGGSVPDRDGRWRTPVHSQPRWTMVDLDGDGVRETPALLIEKETTNPLLRSEDNATSWINFQSTDAQNVRNGPDGLATMDRLIEDVSVGDHHVRQGVTGMTANAPFAFSAALRAGLRTWACLWIRETGATANNVKQWFNLATGAKGTAQNGGTGTVATGYIEPLRDGIFLCTVAGQVNNGATGIDAVISLATADLTLGSGGGAGDGASYIDHVAMQLEDNKLFPTSYVATAGVPVARSGDTFDLGLPAFAPRLATYYVRFIERGTILTSAGRIFQICEGDNNNNSIVLSMNAGSGTYRITVFDAVGNSLGSSTAAVAPKVGDLVEIAITLGAGGVATLSQCLNSGAIAIVSSPQTTLPPIWGSGNARIYVGSRAGSNRGTFALLDFKISGANKTLIEMRESL